MKYTIPFKTLYTSAILSLSLLNAYGQGTINTIAGTGVSSFSGDGGPALRASLFNPSGVAVDASGNILIADRNNNRIRKIDAATGIISTVAGVGYGYSGMGGPAITAGMEYPNAIFVDAVGNWLISDNYADCAYAIDPAGIISNIIGHGSQGCTGDGGDAPLATMELPKGICKDADGNVYVADYGNNRIRKIDAATGFASTFAGTGAHGYSPDGTLAVNCSFGSVDGIAVGVNNNVYVADANNNVVRVINPDGKIRTVTGTYARAGNSGDNGPAVNALIDRPGGLFVNAGQNLFICDLGNNNVRVLSLSTGIMHTLAGNGSMGFSGDGGLATAAQLNQPGSVGEDASGIIYIADAGNNRIRAVVGSGYRSSGSASGVAMLTENDVTLYPNPSNGSFIVQTSSLPNNMTLTVYNAVGQQVYTKKITDAQTMISLNQPSGLYQIVLRSATGSVTKKITVAN